MANTDNLRTELITAFGRMLYSIPTIPAHVVKVDGNSITLCEPLDGIVWIIDILRQDSGCDEVLQNDLEEYLAWWYPPRAENRHSKYTFSKSINKLIGAGFLRSEKNDHNRRQHKLSLTGAGENLLKLVQEHRTHVFRGVLDELTEGQSEALAVALIEIARQVWKHALEGGKRNLSATNIRTTGSRPGEA